MLPAFLVPARVVDQNGAGDPVFVEGGFGRVLLTLAVQKVREQQSLLVSVEGSRDGAEWLNPPLAEFPQRFYPGACALLVDLRQRIDVRFLRAQWKVNRWGRGDKKAVFEFYLVAEALDQQPIAG